MSIQLDWSNTKSKQRNKQTKTNQKQTKKNLENIQTKTKQKTKQKKFKREKTHLNTFLLSFLSSNESWAKESTVLILPGVSDA
jgi:hypothetical protein